MGNLTEKEAFNLERELISSVGFDNLTNQTVGGEGSSGWKPSTEWVDANRERNTGKNNPFYGKHHKKETIENMKKKLSIMFAGENNPNYGNRDKKNKISKEYIITTPEGEEVRIKGLRAFARKHNLSHPNLSACAKGKQKHHKGYNCRYV